MNPPTQQVSVEEIIGKLENAESIQERVNVFTFAIGNADYEGFRLLRDVLSSELKGKWAKSSIRMTIELRRMLAHVYHSLGEFKRSNREVRVALKHVDQSSDPAAYESKLNLQLAENAFHEHGNMKTGGKFLARSLEAAKNTPYKLCEADTLSRIGEYYMNMNLHVKAVEALEQAIAIYEELEILRMKGYALATLSAIYTRSGDFDSGVTYGLKSLETYRVEGVVGESQNSYLSLAQAYFERGELDQAERAANEAMRICEKLGRWSFWAQAASQMGDFLVHRKQHAEAHTLLDKVDSVLENLGNEVLIAENLNSRAMCYFSQEKWSLAIELLREVIERKVRLQVVNSLDSVHHSLASALENLGEVQEALFHYKEGMGYQKNVIGSEVRRMLHSYRIEDEISLALKQRDEYSMQASALERKAVLCSKELALIARRFEAKKNELEKVRTRLNSLARDASETSTQDIVGMIEQSHLNLETWQTFEERFSEIADTFVADITGRFPALTSAEVNICALLRMNLANKEIGTLLGISHLTVMKHRNNIRKKLGVQRKENLVSVVMTV